MPSYVVYNSKLDVGTKYLTEELAYFLGGIYAANEMASTNNQIFWAAPVRYNPQYATRTEIAEHYDCVKIIANKVNVTTIMKDLIKGTGLDSGKNRLNGFSTFFKSVGLTDLNSEIHSLKDALYLSSKEVQKAFIIGVIDGRGTPDVSASKGLLRYLSLDGPTDCIGDFLADIMNRNGLLTNYNVARKRLEGGNPRKNQLRIKNVEHYLEFFGYISPAKIRKLYSVYTAKFGSCNIISGSSFLPGLKYLKG